MSEHIKRTIADLQESIGQLESQIIDRKRTINSLAVMAGMAPVYPDSTLTPAGHTGQIRSDQFYGKALATVVRQILEMRGHALSVNEIYETMVEGGYAFETKNEDNAKRGLRISLAKNSVTFHKVPNGNWGLLEWYPNAKNGGKTEKADAAEVDVDVAEFRKAYDGLERSPEVAVEAGEKVAAAATKK